MRNSLTQKPQLRELIGADLEAVTGGAGLAVHRPIITGPQLPDAELSRELARRLAYARYGYFG